MKTRIEYIVIAFLWLVTLPIYAQDYYSGKSSIKGKHNEYVVDDTEDIAIRLWNKNNKYPIYDSVPYFKDTKKIIITTPDSEPDTSVIAGILESVFTAEEIAKYNAADTFVKIGLCADPLTGKVIEVRCIDLLEFVFDDNNCFVVNKTLLSIPITKLEKLEQLIIQRVVLDIPEEYKTANFVPVWFTIFDNRPRINLS